MNDHHNVNKPYRTSSKDNTKPIHIISNKKILHGSIHFEQRKTLSYYTLRGLIFKRFKV